MTAQQPAQTKHRTIRLSTIALIILAIAVTLFCVGNSERVPVWPLGLHLPVYGVIIISFVLGAAIGWLAKGVLGGRRDLAPDSRVEVMERNAR